MKVVYVAGPFRAATPWEIERNVRNAEDWGLLVAQMGLVPLIPHSMFRWFDGQKTADFWLAATLELMVRCDVILMTPGWDHSLGSRAELAEAQRLGKDVFYASGTPDPQNPDKVRGGIAALAEYADRMILEALRDVKDVPGEDLPPKDVLCKEEEPGTFCWADHDMQEVGGQFRCTRCGVVGQGRPAECKHRFCPRGKDAECAWCGRTLEADSGKSDEPCHPARHDWVAEADDYVCRRCGAVDKGSAAHVSAVVEEALQAAEEDEPGLEH